MAFPPKKDDSKSKGGPPSKGKPPQGGGPQDQQQGGPPGPPQRPPGAAKPGQGMDPHEAMLGGMGDISHLAPPAPPAPGSPMGPGGLPIGGGPPQGDPAFDPHMEGSGLFQALMGQLGGGGGPGQDYDAGPLGHGILDDGQTQDPMGLEQLLAMLAMIKSGVGPDGGQGGMGGAMGPPGMGGGMPPMMGGMGGGMPPMGGPPGMMGGPTRRPSSGLMNEPMNPGSSIGLQLPNIIQ